MDQPGEERAGRDLHHARRDSLLLFRRQVFERGHGEQQITHGWTQSVVANDLTSAVWPGFGLECLAAEIVLAGVLIWSARRHRGTHSGARLAASD